MDDKRYETKSYLGNFERCLEREIPYCVAACPFHLPILNFIEKAKRGSFKAAYKVFRDAAGFPRIACALCHAPCKDVCPRQGHGGPIEMNLLEEAAIRLTPDTSATDYNLPPKKEKVAIVGAGISGMGACLRLATKKYHVEVFEAGGRIGGRLFELLPPELFLAEIEEQLAHQEYALHLHTRLDELESLVEQGFDAIYVATGKGGADFGLLSAAGDTGDPYCMRLGGAGVFAGGELTGSIPVEALAAGLHIGTVIDNFLKTGNLYYPPNGMKTRMCAGMAVPRDAVKAVQPASPAGYTKEEAEAEARRCIECQCHACRDHCDLTAFTDKWPIRIRDEIVATTLQGKSELKATPAKRLMSLCNQCGLCKEVCPQGIDLDGLFLAGRAAMHRQKKTPWPFYDFWLRDMAQAEACGITRPPQGEDTCRYVFFPGCQLGASEPELVERAYERLLELEPATGLMLRCCGVPLEWAGRPEEFAAAMAAIKRDWEALGQPTLVLACPTCMKKFRELLPEAPIRSLYEVLAEGQAAAAAGTAGGGAGRSPALAADGRAWAVFDACAARHEDGVKTAVRRLARGAGLSLAPLPENEAHAKCCSFGGQGAIANPDYQAFVAQRRAAESDAPYVTYCINCRDAFLGQGKETAHILEFLLGDGPAREKAPTVSQRQRNREQLKRTLLKTYWGEEIPVSPSKFDITVRISAELVEKLNQERILEEEIVQTIDFCQRHDRRILDTETGIYSGYCQIGYMTYWVEYRQLEEKCFELVNAYSHRMKIELEAVWNGVKQELDLQ